MKVSHLLEAASISEGMYVVKNKDGKEKRFKDLNSSEAKEWASSSSKKISTYSQEWWEKKKDKDFGATMPWDKIYDGDVPSSTIQKAVKDIWGSSVFDIAGLTRTKNVVVDGVDCARIVLKIIVQHQPNDNIGLEDPVEEIYNVAFTRDVKNPTKFNYQMST